jgi:hypothetical protein
MVRSGATAWSSIDGATGGEHALDPLRTATSRPAESVTMRSAAAGRASASNTAIPHASRRIVPICMRDGGC